MSNIQPALIAEATKRAGLVWISVPGQDRPLPAWHLWHASRRAAYVVTGQGEQPLPGLADGGTVIVAVASKESGGLLVRWSASVTQVRPGSAEWAEVTGPLAAARLNAPAAPDGTSLAERWAATGSVFRLAPVA